MDEINHPSHYTQGAIECIDAIEAALSKEEYIGFLRGQIIKYAWRLNLKDTPLKNVGKTAFYLARLQEKVSGS